MRSSGTALCSNFFVLERINATGVSPPLRDPLSVSPHLAALACLEDSISLIDAL